MKLRLAFLAVLAATSSAFAQDYPSRPINWVVPYSPGGITDNGARTIAKVMSEQLGQPVIIENKPGAGGIVGAEYVANSKKDGYTFLYTANGIVSYPFLFKKLSYDPAKDFIPVHGLQSAAMLVMVREDSPFKSLDDLIAYAKKNPDKLNYSTIGTGSVQHLYGELLQKEAGFQMTAVPYKGTAPALADLLSGVIDVALDFAVTMKPQIEGGKLRALAVSGNERLAVLPDVKSMADLGYPGAAFTAWSAVMLPSGTPQPVVDRLAKSIGDALDKPDIIKYFNDQGAGNLRGMSKEKLAAFLDDERAKMKAIVERSGIQAE